MIEVWGITGLMGAGKSTALAYLQAQGLDVADADRAARLVVDASTEEGKKGLAKLVRAFGPEILDARGMLDRALLRAKISLDAQFRDRLEKELHPLIVDSIQSSVKSWAARGALLAFVEGTRLVEAGFSKNLKGIILVTATQEKRLARVVARDGVTRQQALQMMALQDETAMRNASSVEWDNSTDAAALERQIQSFLKQRQGK